MPKISEFDSADYLKTPEQIAVYLAEACETGDAALLRAAIAAVARANGQAAQKPAVKR